MKNFVKWFGIIALVAVIGFSFASCGGGGGGGGTPPAETPATFSSKDNEGNTYELTFTKAARAVHQPQKGSAYELKYNGKATKSGTVTDVKGKDFVLTPSGSKDTVTITIDNGSMVTIVGVIIYPDGSVAVTITTPVTLYPNTPGGGGGDTLTIEANAYNYPGNTPAKDADFSFIEEVGEDYEIVFSPLSKFLDGSASAKISKGKVTINLGKPKSAYLTEFEPEKGVTVSANVKGFGFQGFTTKKGDYQLIYGSESETGFAGLLYVDQKVTIKGTSTTTDDVEYFDDDPAFPNPNYGTTYIANYNMELEPGWNYQIRTQSVSGKTETYNLTSSSIKSLPNFKWFVAEY